MDSNWQHQHHRARIHSTCTHRHDITLSRTYIRKRLLYLIWHSAFTVMSPPLKPLLQVCWALLGKRDEWTHMCMHRTGARGLNMQYIEHSEQLKRKNEKEEEEAAARSISSSSSVAKEQKYPLSPSHLCALHLQHTHARTLTHTHVSFLVRCSTYEIHWEMDF